MLETVKSRQNVITKMTQGVHDSNRVNIFIDNKFAFSLNLAQVVDFKLKIGRQLSEEELEKCQKASTFGKLYQRTLEWVLTRPRSEKETLDYLRRKRADEEDIEAIVARLKDRNYLDDERFARYYLENRNVTKGASLRKLRQELFRKGISQRLIDQLMSENIRNDEEEIKKIIAKKRSKYDDEKLIAYLVRQGFDYQSSRDAVAGMD